MILCNNPSCSAHKKGTDQLSSAYLDFAGRWYCNKCRQRLLPNEKTKLRVTAESNAYYVRSERLFKEGWLLKTELFGFTPEEAKRKSIELCYRSVSAGNPFAIVSLADHYEQGVTDADISFGKRWSNAVECNAAVAFNEGYIVTVDASGKESNLENATAEALRFEAAMNILRLVLGAPESIKHGKRSYYLEQAKQVCRSALETGAVDSSSPIYSEYTSLLHKLSGRAPQTNSYVTLGDLFKICTDMNGKRRPPLLYVCRMTAQELAGAGSRRLDTGKKRVTLQELCKSSELKLFISKAHGGDFDQFEQFSVPAVTESASPDDSFYVCVYNCRKPQGISQDLVVKVWDRLLANYQTELRELMEMHVLNDYVFTYDDIKLLGTRRNAKSVIDELKNRIRDYFDINA